MTHNIIDPVTEGPHDHDALDSRLVTHDLKIQADIEQASAKGYSKMLEDQARRERALDGGNGRK